MANNHEPRHESNECVSSVFVWVGQSSRVKAGHFWKAPKNQIRKWGIFFIGNPRRLPYEDSHKFYKITADEKMVVEKWWRAYQTPSVWERISDLSHPLRQANLRAAEYFELNHSQEKAIDRLISLAIALEAVFSPSDRGELTFRISQSLSQLVGTTPEDRVEIFKQTKEFYTRRSKLIHGQYDVDAYLENRFVSHLECDIWASAIRKAILRFLVLYLRGHNDRDMVLYELSRAALDAQLADDLRDKSDPDAFLAELFPPNPPQLRQ